MRTSTHFLNFFTWGSPGCMQAPCVASWVLLPADCPGCMHSGRGMHVLSAASQELSPVESRQHMNVLWLGHSIFGTSWAKLPASDHICASTSLKMLPSKEGMTPSPCLKGRVISTIYDAKILFSIAPSCFQVCAGGSSPHNSLLCQWLRAYSGKLQDPISIRIGLLDLIGLGHKNICKEKIKQIYWFSRNMYNLYNNS